MNTIGIGLILILNVIHFLEAIQVNVDAKNVTLGPPVKSFNNIQLPANERYRRLIPYMTFYVNDFNNQQHIAAYKDPPQEEFRPIIPVHNKIEPTRYMHYQQQYVVPSYVVQQQRIPIIQSQPSPLTQMITQNYLAIAKQSGNMVPLQNQIPIQYNNVYTYKNPQRLIPIPSIQQQSQTHIPIQPTYSKSLVQNYIPKFTQRPIEDSVTITQSQELPVQHSISQIKPEIRPAVRIYTYTETPRYQEPVTYANNELYNNQMTDEDDIDKNYNNILEGYEISKALPEKITTENLDSSIKTLSKILRILQRVNSLPQSAKHVMSTFPKGSIIPPLTLKAQKLAEKIPVVDQEGSTPGKAGIDYPIYSEIPQTQFSCKQQRYKGFFGDPETNCQVWHYCDLNGGQASFLCPNGTIFSQVALTCDWWFNVKCDSTAQLYVLNERLYKFILPQKPSFPEDFAGPLVDKYLTEKFREIEEKEKNETNSNSSEEKSQEVEEDETDDNLESNETKRTYEIKKEKSQNENSKENSSL